MSNPWFEIPEVPPPTGVEILVELEGCKIGKYLRTKIRYGEVLGGYKRWRHLSDEDISAKWTLTEGKDAT